jgi:hypothetical protein
MRKALQPKRDPNRNRHGFRGTPPHASFSLAELPDDALLTEHEAAAVGRFSTNTLSAWRRRPNHPLQWELVGGKYIRYRAGNLKAYLALPRKERPRRARTHKSELSVAPEEGARRNDLQGADQ